MPQVHLFRASTHSTMINADGGIGNATRITELVEQLLVKSGYTKEHEHPWKLRIEKQNSSSSAAPMLRVKRAGNFGIIMRVKAKPTESIDWTCTLFVPEGSGYNLENVAKQLQGAQKSVVRNWRAEQRRNRQQELLLVNQAQVNNQEVAMIHVEPAPTPETLTPTVAAEPPVQPEAQNGHATNRIAGYLTVDEPRPDFSTLQGITEDFVKLKYVLRKIQEVGRQEIWSDRVQFYEAVQEILGWQHSPVRIVGRVIHYIAKRGFLVPVTSVGNVITSYSPSPVGLQIIAGEITNLSQVPQREIVSAPPAATVPTPKPPPVRQPIDQGQVLIDFADKALELADAGNKLRQLQEDMVKLDKLRAEKQVEYDRIIAQVASMDGCRLIEQFSRSHKVLPAQDV